MKTDLLLSVGWKRRAFTLIEMMVVVAIIAIMAGMVFKLFVLVTRTANKSETIAILEKVADACEEYRAEYGMFPPVQEVGYEYENATNQTAPFRDGYLPDNKDYTATPLFEFANLVAHLWNRDRGGIVHKDGYVQWIGDSPRDVKAKARWARFLEGVPLDTEDKGDYDPSSLVGVYSPYTNQTTTVIDAWGNEINYKCYAPYLKYRLWSNGKDGSSGTADDIHRDKWDD